MTALQRKYFGKRGSRKASRSRRRTRVVYRPGRTRTRTVTKIVRVGARSGFGAITRRGGGVLSRIQHGIIPMAKASGAIAGGAIAGGVFDRLVPALPFLGRFLQDERIRAGLELVAAVLGIAYAEKVARVLPFIDANLVRFFAAGVGTDATFRLTQGVRAALPLLASTAGRKGLLSGQVASEDPSTRPSINRTVGSIQD